MTKQPQPGFSTISNIAKSFYAPLAISTKHFPLLKKIFHHLRHQRPAWYKRYHSYAFVHYLHFAVFLVYATILGFTIYEAFSNSSIFHAPVLASLPASPPRTITFKGTLTDTANNPITAEKNLRFGLYNSPSASGSALLWQENQGVTPDQNGNFSVTLGRNQPIYQNMLSDNPTLFIGITIGNSQELLPRQQIATVAYSKEAQTVQGLAPITQPDAGTSNVLLALDSSGNMTIGGTASPKFEATGGQFTLAGKTLTLTTAQGTNTNIELSPDGSGIIDIQKPIQNTTNYNNLPGITGAVEVDDSLAISANTNDQSALIINQNSTGDLISASGSGTAKFTVNYVGGGTFADDLAVNGNNLTTNSPTFNLLNNTVVTLNIGAAASALSLGASSGITTINNSINVHGASTLQGAVNVNGLFTANGGVTIPNTATLTMQGFNPGAIPFLNSSSQVAQDSTNFFWAQDTKRLGLGTNTPAYRLDVRDSSGGSISQIYNTNSSTDADGLTIKLGASTPGTSNNFISFVNGSDTIMGKITGSGGGNVIYNTSGADYAEYYKKADLTESLEAGDVVCIVHGGGVTKCSGDTSRMLGVVSNTAGFVGAGNHDNDPTYVLVGIVGQLPVKIASGSAALAAGDPVSIGPYGLIKANKPGVILGHTLEAYFGQTAEKTVNVALNIGWYDPTLALTDTGDIIPQEQQVPPDFGQSTIADIIDSIKIGGLGMQDYLTTLINNKMTTIENKLLAQKIISPIAEIDEVKTNLISGLSPESAISLKFKQSSISVLNASSSAVATIDNEGNASFSGTLRAKRIIADEIVGANVTNVTNIYNTYATPSAASVTPASAPREIAADQNSTDQFASGSANTAYVPSDALCANPLSCKGVSGSSNFTDAFAKFNNGLIALGASSFTDVGITGTLHVGSNMLISDTSINTVGSDLAIQSLRQGNISFMGDLVKIDTQGNLNVAGNATFAKDVTVKGTLTAGLIVPVPDQDLLFQLPQGKRGSQNKFKIQNEKGADILSIDHKGNLLASGSGMFKDVITNAFTIVRGAQADTSIIKTTANASAGVAIIKANQTERTIVSPFMKQNSLVYITTTSNPQGAAPYVARQTKDSFTVQIPSSVSEDIKFNWWIVN